MTIENEISKSKLWDKYANKGWQLAPPGWRVLPPKNMNPSNPKFMLKSKTVDAAVVLLLMALNLAFDIKVPEDTQQQLVYGLSMIIAAGVVIWGRIDAKDKIKIKP